MPFGNESTWDKRAFRTLLTELLVTNAFRQRVHLGPLHKGATAKLARESPMPFGNESTWDLSRDAGLVIRIAVTNAFRQRVHLGRK